MDGVTEFRLYRTGDEVGITRLFKEVFGRDMSLREWRWKYHESHPDKVYSSVAVDTRGTIVGHYGGVCHPLMYLGRRERALAICDVMIQKEFRGIAALRRLSHLVPAEAVRDGIIMGYGFPTESTLLRPALSLGIYEKVEDVMEATKTAVFRNDSVRYLFQLFPLEFTDARIDALWESCRNAFPLAVVRDRRYLSWRYNEHPLFHYELWGLRRRMSSRLSGLAVLKKEKERVLVMDFLAVSGSLTPLWKKLENHLRSSGWPVITLWAPPFLEDMLTSNGFSLRPAGTSIPRTTHERTLAKEDMAGKFFYTMGDTDFL